MPAGGIYTLSHITEVLRQTDYFADLPDPVLESLAERIKTRHFKDGETIFAKGSTGNAIFVIASGEVKISVTSTTQQEITLALLSVGDAFGELSLLDGGQRSASAIAEAETEVLALYRDDFLSVIDSDSAVLHGLLHVLARIIRRTNQRVVDAAMLDLAGRVSKVLLDMVRRHGQEVEGGILITRELSYRDVASMSGMYTGEAEKVLSNYQYESVVERQDDGRWLIRQKDVLERSVGGV